MGKGNNLTRVYLHIGTMKTGTSAIQRFLADNREQLERQGYAYPLMEQGLSAKYNYRNGHFLIYPFDYQKSLDPKEVRKGAFAQLAGLAERFPNIILSEELIWHRDSKQNDFWRCLIKDFGEIGCELKLIVYLRRQDLLADSMYNQSIKSNRMMTGTLEDYLEAMDRSPLTLDYDAHLKKLVQELGRENLVVRVYDGRMTASSNRILADFMETVGLSPDAGYHIEETRRNLSLSGNFIEFKRIANGLSDYRELNDFLRTALRCANAESGAGGRESFFTDELRSRFLERYEEGNARVAAEYLGREDGILFPEPEKLPKPWKLDQEKLHRDLLVTMLECFCQQERKNIELRERLERLEEWRDKSLCYRGKQKIKNILSVQNTGEGQ